MFSGFFFGPIMIYELQIQHSSADPFSAEIIIELLGRIGVDPKNVIENRTVKHGNFLSVFFERERQLTEIVRLLRTFHLKGLVMRKKALKTEDWRDRWKKDLKPFKLTDRFDVVPVWSKAKKRSKREAIYLDTTLAFGTGLHETTRFMAYLIENHRGRFETFLDIGTGTGLLSIVASKCGAQEVCAVDIDANSVATACTNMKANHFKFVSIAAGDFRGIAMPKTFDYVAANIITDELLSMKERMIGCVAAGGSLAVSGISLKNLSRFRRLFKSPELLCRRVLRGETWAAILYKKRMTNGE